LKIFLGYPSEHVEKAWEVYHFLHAKGHDVWFDKKSLVGGVEWDKERERGQQEAELVVHLCSAAILNRTGVVNREIRQSLRLVEDQPLGALYVIPIRLEKMNLPVELLRFQFFDFDESWKERLSDAVEKRKAQLCAGIPESSIHSVTKGQGVRGLPRIEFEELTSSYECRGDYYRYEYEGLYWTYVNGAIASHVLDSFYEHRREFHEAYTDDNVDAAPNRRKSEWSVCTEEFFRSDDLLSLRFYSYIGYAQAAHPHHHITTLNFFGENTGTLSIEKLLGYSTESALKIIRFCEKVISAQLDSDYEQEAFFDYFKSNNDSLWALLGQYSFDKRGLTFNFSPYDVLPYAFGSHEVLVSWSFLEGLVSDSYNDIFNRVRS
jgi:hypothetical protein